MICAAINRAKNAHTHRSNGAGWLIGPTHVQNYHSLCMMCIYIDWTAHQHVSKISCAFCSCARASKCSYTQLFVSSIFSFATCGSPSKINSSSSWQQQQQQQQQKQKHQRKSTEWSVHRLIWKCLNEALSNMHFSAKMFIQSGSEELPLPPPSDGSRRDAEIKEMRVKRFGCMHPLIH